MMHVVRGFSGHVPDSQGSPVNAPCLCLCTASLDIQEFMHIQPSTLLQTTGAKFHASLQICLQLRAYFWKHEAKQQTLGGI